MGLQEELGLDRPFQDRRHETVLSIVRTAALLTAVGEELFRDVGLTEAQFNVLMVLRYSDAPPTQVELGRKLVVSRASVTSVLDRMEKKGLIRRRTVAGNRRIRRIELTAAGKEALDRVEPPYRKRLHAALAPLGERDCENLLAVLERLRANVLPAKE